MFNDEQNHSHACHSDARSPLSTDCSRSLGTAWVRIWSLYLPTFGGAVWILVSGAKDTVADPFSSGSRLGEGKEGVEEGKKGELKTPLCGDGDGGGAASEGTGDPLACPVTSTFASLVGTGK